MRQSRLVVEEYTMKFELLMLKCDIVVIMEEEIASEDDLLNESNQEDRWLMLIKVSYLSFREVWVLFMMRVKIGFIAIFFYICCSANGKVCDVIVDTCACANIVSTDMVNKL